MGGSTQREPTQKLFSLISNRFWHESIAARALYILASFFNLHTIIWWSRDHLIDRIVLVFLLTQGHVLLVLKGRNRHKCCNRPYWLACIRCYQNTSVPQITVGSGTKMSLLVSEVRIKLKGVSGFRAAVQTHSCSDSWSPVGNTFLCRCFNLFLKNGLMFRVSKEVFRQYHWIALHRDSAVIVRFKWRDAEWNQLCCKQKSDVI